MLKLTAQTTASKGTSENNLRTAIPKTIKEALEITAKDKIDWTLTIDENTKLTVTIQKAKTE